MVQIDLQSSASLPIVHLLPGKTPPAGPPAAAAAWPVLDAAVLGARQAAVPRFPLDLLPAPWRAWVSDTATAANVPADYVAQAVLAAVAGLCGAGVWVGVSAVWSAPLSLWLAAVGAPSSGKSPALAPVHRLLRRLESEGTGAPRRTRRIVVGGSTAEVSDATEGNQRGVVLWRDEPAGCFAPLPDGASVRQLDPFPVTILGALEPDRLVGTLQRGDATVAARFLYALPAPPPFQPLAGRKPARDEEALALLRAIRGKAGTIRRPLHLHVDDEGIAALDRFLAGLHADLGQAEGLLAAWLGKGRGVVPRLAAVLHLLDWSARQRVDPSMAPGDLGGEAIERAVALWSGYYRAHATAFFGDVAPADLDARARRVVRWLQSCALDQVSREDIRRTALGQTVTASETDRILARLTEAGVLRSIATPQPAQRGRPALRWEVNPALREA